MVPSEARLSNQGTCTQHTKGAGALNLHTMVPLIEAEGTVHTSSHVLVLTFFTHGRGAWGCPFQA